MSIKHRQDGGEPLEHEVGEAVSRPASASDNQRLYVNHCEVSFELAEAFLDFGQAFDAKGPKLSARLVTSPIHLMRFGEQISEQCKIYQRKFGSPASPQKPADTSADTGKDGVS